MAEVYSPGKTLAWNLGKRYRSFSATVGLLDTNPDSDVVYEVQLLLDGKKVETKQLDAYTSWVVSQPVAGVVRLELAIKVTRGSGQVEEEFNYLGGGDPRVTR